MLAPALRRHVHNRTLQNLQQGLLHALARDIARDARVVALACNLVYLVDEDYTLLGRCDIIVGNLQQTRQNALHILAHISRLGENRGVDDREWHLQQASYRPCHKRLARTRGAHEHYVRLVDLHIVLRGAILDILAPVGLTAQQTLVVVVDGNRHISLGIVLTNDVLIQKLLYLLRLEQLLHLQLGPLAAAFRRHGLALDEHLVRTLDAIAAYIRAVHTLKQYGHITALGAAERAAILAAAIRRLILVSSCIRHSYSLLLRLVSTSSMSPYSLASAAVIQ